MKILLFISLAIVLLGCESQQLKHNVYDALLQRECIQKTGEPNCESGQPFPENMSYEEYQREREKLNKESN